MTYSGTTNAIAFYQPCERCKRDVPFRYLIGGKLVCFLCSTRLQPNRDNLRRAMAGQRYEARRKHWAKCDKCHEPSHALIFTIVGGEDEPEYGRVCRRCFEAT